MAVPVKKRIGSKKRDIAPFDYREAFSRNIGLLSTIEQERLRGATVAIPGCGGAGSIHAAILARMGVGRFKIADFDSFELANFNRQMGARISTLGQSKVETTRNDILEINPEAVIEEFDEGINGRNIDEFLKGVHVVCDALDFFAFNERTLLFMRARELGIPVVTGAPLGFSCAMLSFDPSGMSFLEYFDLKESDSLELRCLKFAVGLAPKGTHIKYMNRDSVDFSARRGPSSSIGITQCASMVSAEAVKIILGRNGKFPAAPHFVQFDAYRTKLKRGVLRWGNRGPIQRLKIWLVKRFLFNRKERSTLPEGLKLIYSAKASEKIDTHTIRQIIDAIRWAPTGDNCQPFHYEWNGTTLTIKHSEYRAQHALNINNQGSYLSLGAALEYLEIASLKFGFKPSVRLELSDDVTWAHVTFKKVRVEPQPLYGELFNRHTDRRPFGPKIPKHWILDDIREMKDEGQNISVHVKTDIQPEFVRICGKLDEIVWSWRSAHEGLFRWLRFGRKRSGDGMPHTTLGPSQIETLLLRLFKNYAVQTLMNRMGFLQLIRMKSMKNLKSSTAVVMITGRNTSPEDFVGAGRLATRMWLKANQIGFGVQPLTIASMFIFGVDSSELVGDFPRSNIKDIELGRKIIRDSFSLRKDEIPFWMFRLGPARGKMKAKADRLPVEDLLTQTTTQTIHK